MFICQSYLSKDGGKPLKRNTLSEPAITFLGRTGEMILGYSRFSLLAVVMFDEVIVNTELAHAGPLLMEKHRVRVLGASGHNVLTTDQYATFFYVCLCLKTP